MWLKNNSSNEWPTTKWNNPTAYYVMKLCSLATKKLQRQTWLFLFKEERPVLIRRLSINVTLKLLLLAARFEKSSKSCAILQTKRCPLMAEPLSPVTLPPLTGKVPRCSHILTLKWRLVLLLIGSIAETALKLVNNSGTSERWNFFFNCKKIITFALTLENKPDIKVREFIFHYVINSSVYLEKKLA